MSLRTSPSPALGVSVTSAVPCECRLSWWFGRDFGWGQQGPWLVPGKAGVGAPAAPGDACFAGPGVTQSGAVEVQPPVTLQQSLLLGEELWAGRGLESLNWLRVI